VARPIRSLLGVVVADEPIRCAAVADGSLLFCPSVGPRVMPILPFLPAILTRRDSLVSVLHVHSKDLAAHALADHLFGARSVAVVTYLLGADMDVFTTAWQVVDPEDALAAVLRPDGGGRLDGVVVLVADAVGAELCAGVVIGADLGLQIYLTDLASILDLHTRPLPGVLGLQCDVDHASVGCIFCVHHDTAINPEVKMA